MPRWSPDDPQNTTAGVSQFPTGHTWKIPPEKIFPSHGKQFFCCVLKSKKSIAMHWGTFQLTDEPMDEPVKLLKKLTIENNLLSDEFIAMTHGESKIL